MTCYVEIHYCDLKFKNHDCAVIEREGYKALEEATIKISNLTRGNHIITFVKTYFYDED